jgi:ribonuclease HI
MRYLTGDPYWQNSLSLSKKDLFNLDLKIKNILSQESHTVKIITDGSASPKSGFGAWAAYIVTPTEEIILKDTEPNVTQHTMELKAVIESLKYIQSTFQNVSALEIYSDSDYVLGLLRRRERLENKNYQTKKGKEIKNRSLIIQFYEFLDRFDVRMLRVEGHARKGQSKITDYHREVDKLSRKLVRQKSRDS